MICSTKDVVWVLSKFIVIFIKGDVDISVF